MLFITTLANPLLSPHRERIVVRISTTSYSLSPKLLRDSLDRIHHVQPVNGNEAVEMTLNLAKKEGIFTGVSGGGAVVGAIAFAKKLVSEKKIVGRPLNVCAIVADTGERYLSTLVFENIPVYMSPEEISISNSTPMGQFSAPSSSDKDKPKNDEVVHSSALGKRPASTPVTPAPDLNPEAEQFVNDTLSKNKIVMFSLEWCEFCHTVTKLFKAANIDFYTFPLDSASNMKNNWGIGVRKVISSMTECKTIPQIFIGGTFVGGAMDIVQGFRDDSLKPKLLDVGITYKDDVNPDAYLPNWVSKSAK